MPGSVIPGPVSEDTQIREATCIHTQKIYDSCQSKDCMEDLRFYPTACSQSVLDNAQSVKSGRAELLYVDVEVAPAGFHQGFYTVDCHFFYRVTADAYTSGSCRPTCITGLALFSKRSMLFGSQGRAKIFTSDQSCPIEASLAYDDNLPTAVIEAVDPIVLAMKLTERCGCGCNCGTASPDVPKAILDAFDDTIVFDNNLQRQLLLSLGQFSILRLERDSQLLIPIYDYCMPERECECGSSDEDPCDLFQRVDFPVNEFFPPATADGIDPVAQLRNGNCR